MESTFSFGRLALDALLALPDIEPEALLLPAVDPVEEPVDELLGELVELPLAE